jgi:cold shock CspA family protein
MTAAKMFSCILAPSSAPGFNDLHEGQKVTYDIVADRRTGKSSADNLKAV